MKLKTKKTRKMKVEYTCQNEKCQHQFRVNFTAADPWNNAVIAPGECVKCSTDVDFETVENDGTPDKD